MTTHIEPAAMDVDSDQSPSVKSDHSSVSFSDDFETLPSSGASSQAHIIDLGEYAEMTKEDGMLNLQDAIATTLLNVGPETLKSFLSPLVNNFKIVFGKKDVQLVVWRKGIEVFVSHCVFPLCHWLTVVCRSAPSSTTRA
jgi:hypothetical protein